MLAVVNNITSIVAQNWLYCIAELSILNIWGFIFSQFEQIQKHCKPWQEFLYQAVNVNIVKPLNCRHIQIFVHKIYLYIYITCYIFLLLMTRLKKTSFLVLFVKLHCIYFSIFWISLPTQLGVNVLHAS